MRFFPALWLAAFLAFPGLLGAESGKLHIQAQDAAGGLIRIAGAGAKSLSRSPVSVSAGGGRVTLTSEAGAEADVELNFDPSVGIAATLRVRFGEEQALTLALVPVDVSGRALLGDQPLAGVPVSLCSDGITPWGSARDAAEFLPGVRARIAFRTVSGADGRFRFTRAIPQNYAVACGPFTAVLGPVSAPARIGREDLWIRSASAAACAIQPLGADSTIDLGDAFIFEKPDARLTLKAPGTPGATVTLTELPAAEADAWPSASGRSPPSPRRVRARIEIVTDAKGEAAGVPVPSGVYLPRVGAAGRLDAVGRPLEVTPGDNSAAVPPPNPAAAGTLVVDAGPLWGGIRKRVLGTTSFRVGVDVSLAGGPHGWPDAAGWLSDVESGRMGFRRAAGVYNPIKTDDQGALSFVKGVESATFENVPAGNYTARTHVWVEWMERPEAGAAENEAGRGEAAALERTLRALFERQVEAEVREGGTMKVRVAAE